MFLKTQKGICELLDSVAEMIDLLDKLGNKAAAIDDCLAAIGAVQSQLSQESTPPSASFEKLNELLIFFNDSNHALLTGQTYRKESGLEIVSSLQQTIREEIPAKLKIAFFPYKASMWDSLESIYHAAMNDDNCVAQVIPIPYYQLSQSQAIPHYEGDRFPKDIPITHFNDYNLENEQPDIIYVHNIYDQYNTLTRVHERYFTSNLKNYTDMLVYVPYHISAYSDTERFLAFNLPTVQFVDKIILAGDYLYKRAVADGVPRDKLLALGSPKFDALLRALNHEDANPPKWKEETEGKTVFLLNTGCLFFALDPFGSLENIANFFNIPRFIDNSVVIWRPHPLTKASIEKYTPALLSHYERITTDVKTHDKLYPGVIFDEEDDYLPALTAADALITAESSLLRSFLLTEKPIVLYHREMPKSSLLPPDSFYYVHNRSEPWFEVVRNLANGLDPLAKNRKGLVSKCYTNTDGTSGIKIYERIKHEVLLQYN